MSILTFLGLGFTRANHLLGGHCVPDINSLMMQGKAYQGMPAGLGAPSLMGSSAALQQNTGAASSLLAQPAHLNVGNGSPSVTDPLAFANGAGAFGVPYANGGFNQGFNQGFTPGFGTSGYGNSGYYPQQNGYPVAQEGLGIPRQNTPTGYPAPVSGNKLNDVMFSLFQGVGIALKIRMELNAQKQQQKELEAALQQQQMEALLNRGNQLQGDMHQQWAEQDRLYEEAERRLGKTHKVGYGTYGEIGSESAIQREVLAAKAREVATEMNTTGYCARGVQNTLINEMGVNDIERCASAYQMAEQLKKSKKFVSIPYDQRGAGDVIVFGRTSVKPHGHVAIQLANAKQASDHIENDADPNKYGDVEVFRKIA